MADNKTLNQEAGLPENWVPADTPPIIPGAPPALLASQPASKFLQGSIPPSFQQNVDFVDTVYDTPNAPRHSLMPLSIAANPVSNAAVQSTIIKTAPAAVASSSGAVKAELIVPNIFTPVDQTVGLPGPLEFALAPENENTIFGVRQSAGGGTADFVDQTSGNVTTQTLSDTARLPDTVLAFTATCGVNITTPVPGISAGFSTVDGTTFPSSNAGFWFGQFPVGPVSATFTCHYLGGAYPVMCNGLIGFVSAGTPVFTKLGSTSGNAASWTIILTTVTAGLPLIFAGFIADMQYWNTPQLGKSTSSHIASVSDSAGNTWIQILNPFFTHTFSGTDLGAGLSVWVCMNPAAGSHVTVSISADGTSDLSPENLTIYSMTNIAKVQNIPAFIDATTANFPNLGMSTIYPNELASNGIGTSTQALFSSGLAGVQAVWNDVWYQLVEQAGTPATQRRTLNFLSPAVVTDNPGNGSTDISFSIAHVAVEVNGTPVATDKQFFFNGISDGSTVWGVNTNGTPDGG